jgi:hypothetical protein
VGQHSVCCCLEAIERDYEPRVCLGALLHDASEAYLCDIIRPIKKELPQYLAIEEVLQNMIYQKFLRSPLVPEEMQRITDIDDTMLSAEFKFFMNEELPLTKSALSIRPTFAFRPFSDTEEEFLKYFHRLSALL